MLTPCSRARDLWQAIADKMDPKCSQHLKVASSHLLMGLLRNVDSSTAQLLDVSGRKASSVLTNTDPEPLGNIICNRLLGIYEEMCVAESALSSALPSHRHSIAQALGNLLAT